MSEVAETVRAVVAEHLCQDEAIVVDEARLIECLGADELDLIEIAMELEERLGIETLDDAIAAQPTVGDLIRYVEGVKAAQAA